MKAGQKCTVIVVLAALLGYHGCVYKTERGYESSLRWQLENGELSQAAYQRKMRESTYWKHFLNFPLVIRAWD